MVELQTDAVMSYDYEVKDRTNPFVEQQVSLEVVAHIVDDLAQSSGKGQQEDCSRMKYDLMALGADGSGRIPFSTFYIK